MVGDVIVFAAGHGTHSPYARRLCLKTACRGGVIREPLIAIQSDQEGTEVLKKIAKSLVSKAEKRIGVELDYAHRIAETDFGLMARYGKIFGFLDPNKNVPPLAYHVARLRGALAADCGTCVEAEINLAKQAGIAVDAINAVLLSDFSNLSGEVSAVARLTDAVVSRREDDADAREEVRRAFGEAGLIEISYAMNGAALLPGIKRAMGYATHCDISLLSRKI